MKKNLVVRIAAIVLMCTLVTACFASSTFARYTSEGGGSDTVTVAKWDIDIDDEDITDDIEFDLFDTILEEDGSTEEDVNADRIAPGTSGEFVVKVTNNSEVTAQIDLDIEIADCDFITVSVKSLDKLVDKGNNVYTLAAGQTANVTYKWVWEIDANDADTDNDLAGETITANVDITATQYQKELA